MLTSSDCIKIHLHLPKKLSATLSHRIPWLFNYVYNYLLYMKKADYGSLLSASIDDM